MKIFLGISGASGVNLGLKLAFEIAKRAQLHLCMSKNAMNVLEKELNFTDFFRKNGENLNIIGATSGKFDEATAKSLIIKGFVEPISKELPLEYAVELNNLISIELEGTIG